MSQPEHYEPILQFFAYEHLPPKLQEISKPFGVLANGMTLQLPRNPERTVALRKLLEAKDAAIRAKLFGIPEERPMKPQKPFDEALAELVSQYAKSGGSGGTMTLEEINDILDGQIKANEESGEV